MEKRNDYDQKWAKANPEYMKQWDIDHQKEAEAYYYEIEKSHKGRKNEKEWRRAVLMRDHFTCQKCGKHGGELDVHHINNFADFPELETDVANGIALCRDCHNEFHRNYGKRNNTQEQLEEFFKTVTPK